MEPAADSDGEHLIQEIEAFLRTGYAPPAAAEPVAASAASRGDAPPVVPRRTVLPPVETVGPGAHPAGRGRRRPVWHRWMLPLYRLRLRRGHAASPARWTPVRIVVVLALLVALIGLPAVYDGHTSPPQAAQKGYTYLRTDASGAPFRWNPCSPVHYRVNLEGAPGHTLGDIEAAFGTVSEATGLTFVDDGPTSAAGKLSDLTGPDGRPGPVEVVWTTLPTPTTSSPAGERLYDDLGRAESVAAVNEFTGHGLYVTGALLLDPAAAGLPAGFGPGSFGTLLLHLLGTLTGLGPTGDRSSIMYPALLGERAGVFGPGDLQGLDRLGAAAGCAQEPTGAALEPSF